MKLNINAFSSAAAVTLAICYTICVSSLYLWPKQALKAMASMLQMSSFELFEPYFQVTFVNYLSGLVMLAIWSFAFVWVMATIYNNLCDRMKG